MCISVSKHQLSRSQPHPHISTRFSDHSCHASSVALCSSEDHAAHHALIESQVRSRARATTCFKMALLRSMGWVPQFFLRSQIYIYFRLVNSHSFLLCCHYVIQIARFCWCGICQGSIYGKEFSIGTVQFQR